MDNDKNKALCAAIQGHIGAGKRFFLVFEGGSYVEMSGNMPLEMIFDVLPDVAAAAQMNIPPSVIDPEAN